MEPVILTSIALGKSIQQRLCVESWRDKYSVYSLNKESEINELQEEYPWVVFVVARDTAEEIFKRPLVSIDCFIKFAESIKKDVLIINADILLTKNIEFNKEGIGVGSRWDYDDKIEDAVLLRTGFDYFYIRQEYLKYFHEFKKYYMGECWWDYMLPWVCINNNIPMHNLNLPIAFHKKHEIRYSAYERRYMENIVMKDKELIGFRTNNGRGLNAYVLGKIISKFVKE